MVRVNHPPGGAAKLHSETTREPQTVRILQPPGGESSISFSDDSNSRNVAQSSKGHTKNLPSPEPNQTEVQAEDTNHDNDTSSQQNGSEGKTFNAQTSVDSTPSVSSAQEATAVAEEWHSEVKEDGEAKTSAATIESVSTEKLHTSDCNVENDVVVSESQTSSECIIETSASEDVVEKSSEVTSTTSETHHTSEVKETSASHENGVHEVNDSEKVTTESLEKGAKDKSESQTSSISNGVKSPNLPPLTMQQAQSSAHQPQSPSPSPSSPSNPNEDTRCRVFGQPAGITTPQPVQPRKIKDHMRSNIFMSDEDYTPTRSSRANAAPVTDPKPDVPAAGQRRRIPPGGFSTPLW